MKRISYFPVHLGARNHRQRSISVEYKNQLAAMQTISSPLIGFFGIVHSGARFDDIDLLSSTNPAAPFGARWWTVICT